MGALLGLFEVEFRPAHDELLLEAEVLVDDVAQVEYLRLGLVIDQCQHVYRKARLHLRLRQQAVQNDLGICVALELDDDAHAVAVGLVAHVGYALDALIAHVFGDRRDELALVDLIGKLGDDDPCPVLSELLKLRARTHDDLAAAGHVGLADAAAAHDNTLCREVGSRDVLQKLAHRRLRVIEHADAGVYDLGEVVRRDVRRHADGDARRAVYQQVRKSRRQHARLFSRLVEVGVPVDRVLLDIAQHFVRHARHARLGVTVRRRGVAVDRAEVAVTLDERIAHREVLRKAHQRIVHRRVAVRMVSAEHVADSRRAFAEGLVVREVILVHRVQNSAVHWLEAVAHVGQRTPDYNAHRVLYIARFHLADQL